MDSAARPTVPPPSWDAVSDMHARIDRPEAWTTAISWAVDQLRRTLGEDWAAQVAQRDPKHPLWAALVHAMSHPAGAAELLEWALRLELLSDFDGMGDVRRDLRRDLTAARGLHTQLQLELAGHVLRHDWPLRLEPPGSASPGDVAFDVPENGRVAVETKALRERERTRQEREAISALTDHLHFAALPRGLWVAGQMHRMPTEDEVRQIEGWIATSAAAGGQLSGMEGIELYLVPRDAAEGHGLRSSPITDRLLPRMVGAMGIKSHQMRGSGAAWLRVTALTGLWATTEWGLAALVDKLPSMAAALAHELGANVPDGVVLSSAAGRSNGQADEIVTSHDGIAVRRAIAPGRGRETLILPFTDAGREHVALWLLLTNAESDWLDWALGEVGLGSVSDVFGT